MPALNLDGDTNYEGKDDIAPHRKQAAVTPMSAGFGSPVPAHPWTGGLPAKPIKQVGPKQSQRARQQERKPKPSYFEEESAAPSPHEDDKEIVSTNAGPSNAYDQRPKPLIPTDEGNDPWIEAQKPPRKAQNKNPAYVVDNTHRKQYTFSDPKDAHPSPTPRPRAARSQNGKQKDNVIIGRQKIKEKGMFDLSSAPQSLASHLPESPGPTKLTDAMRGASALAPSQENAAKVRSNEKRTHKNLSSAQPKLSALELENPDGADVFDTANLPSSGRDSPLPARKGTKPPPKQLTSKAKKAATRQSQKATKSKAQVKLSPTSRLDKGKKSETTVNQKDNSVADDTFKAETQDNEVSQQTRRRSQRGKAPVSEVEHKPITVTSGSNTDDSSDPEPSSDNGDSDYVEKGKHQQADPPGQPPRGGPRSMAVPKQSGTAKKQTQEKAEAKKQARKSTIIPFDKMGTKTNGLSRAKPTSRGSQVVDRATTGASGEQTAVAPSLHSPAALEMAHRHDVKDSHKAEEETSTSTVPKTGNFVPRDFDDSAVQGLSSSNMIRHRTVKEVQYSDFDANDNGVTPEYPGLEATPPSDNHTDMRYDDGAEFMVDGHLAEMAIEAPHDVAADRPDGNHLDRDCSSTDGGQLITPHMHQHDNRMQLDSVNEVKPSLNRSLPLDEYVQPLPSINHRICSNPEIRPIQPQPEQTIQQTFDVTMNRPVKRQRHDQTTTGTVLESLLTRSDQQDLVATKKPSSREASGTRRRSEPEITNDSFKNPTRDASDKPGPMTTAGTKFSKVHQHSFRKNQSKFEPMPKQDIAQQFLADMTSRSLVLDQEAASEPAKEGKLAEPLDDTTWDDDHAVHQKRLLARRLSARERAFEEAPVTPDQALSEAMHKIVGVCSTFSYTFTRPRC